MKLHQIGFINRLRAEDPAGLATSLLQCIVLTAESMLLSPCLASWGGGSDRKNDALGVIGRHSLNMVYFSTM